MAAQQARDGAAALQKGLADAVLDAHTHQQEAQRFREQVGARVQLGLTPMRAALLGGVLLWPAGGCCE